MAQQSYFAHLNRIKHDPRLIELQKRRWDRVIHTISSGIKAAITPKTAAALIWSLSWNEFLRACQTLENLGETPVSDFAGHARYLRAVAASVGFQSMQFADDPRTEYLLERCDMLWHAMLEREMLGTLTSRSKQEQKKRHIASAMCLLSAVQLEIKYVEQAVSRVRKLYEPFSCDIIEPAMGLSVEKVVRGFQGIEEIMAKRRDAIGDLLDPMTRKRHEFVELASTDISDADLDAFVLDDPEYQTIADSYSSGIEHANEILVFSPTDLEPTLGNRSPRFFAEFSFLPGHVNVDFNTPFDRNAILARPFARLADGRFLLMDAHHCSFAPLYRLPEMFTEPKDNQKLTKRRDKVLEADACLLLTEVVQPQSVFTNYYLPVGKDGVLAERDLLLLRDRIAFVVESKARPLRSIADHRGNIRKIESDVKQAIQQGYDQACSVRSHLLSASDTIALWDSDGPDKKELGRVAHDRIDEAFIIVVLDIDYGLIAADLAPWLRVNNDVGFPWVVDRDTMESIFSVLSLFEQLAPFLRWRKSLHGVALNEDEAVFAGFFLRHGPCEMPTKNGLVQLPASYADVFETEHFRRKGIPVNVPEETGPPVWTSMKRERDSIVFRIDGKVHDAFNLHTACWKSDSVKSEKRARQHETFSTVPRTKRGEGFKARRNSPCPCGSGRKYKNCCLCRR